MGTWSQADYSQRPALSLQSTQGLGRWGVSERDILRCLDAVGAAALHRHWRQSRQAIVQHSSAQRFSQAGQIAPTLPLEPRWGFVGPEFLGSTGGGGGNQGWIAMIPRVLLSVSQK